MRNPTTSGTSLHGDSSRDRSRRAVTLGCPLFSERHNSRETSRAIRFSEQWMEKLKRALRRGPVLPPACERGLPTRKRCQRHGATCLRFASWAKSLGSHVAITVGEHGATGCVTGQQPFWFKPDPVQALDTVGTGDCFVRFFAAFLQRGMPWQHALAGGVFAASESVKNLGSQVAYPQ